MLSLKELLFDNVWKNSDSIDYSWYNTYRDNLMEFLENAYIDKIHCGRGYRIIIMKDKYDELIHFVARFVPKNNDDDETSSDSDYSDEKYN